MTVVIDDRCTACGACLATCPERALLRAPLRPLVVDSLCTGCLACVEVCPRDALTEVSANSCEPVTSRPVPGGRIVTDSQFEHPGRVR